MDSVGGRKGWAAGTVRRVILITCHYHHWQPCRHYLQSITSECLVPGVISNGTICHLYHGNCRTFERNDNINILEQTVRGKKKRTHTTKRDYNNNTIIVLTAESTFKREDLAHAKWKGQNNLTAPQSTDVQISPSALGCTTGTLPFHSSFSFTRASNPVSWDSRKRECSSIRSLMRIRWSTLPLLE